MRFNTKKLAMAIRNRRLQLNYSQEYVSSKLNMSQNAYSKIELGYTAITIERFVDICYALETEVSAMLNPLLDVA